MSSDKIISKINNMSAPQAAKVGGIGLTLMFLISIIGVMGIVTITESRDTSTILANIDTNPFQFQLGIVSYLIVLCLDVVVAVSLYVVLKKTNKNLALLMSILRVVYALLMALSVLALAMLSIELHLNGELVAYAFFIIHLFILGYLVSKSDYIPKSFGTFLMIASFAVVILTYGTYILPEAVYEPLYLISMIPATFAELSFGIWLLLKGSKLQ